MLVDVVRMRRAGVKLTPAELQEVAPLRARLRIVTRRREGNARPAEGLVTFAYLFDPYDDDPILLPMMQLHSAHVNALHDGAMVIVGTESIRVDGLHLGDEAQAWLCRIASA